MNENTNCPNCNTPLSGPFCSNCGQNQKSIRFFLFTLINEAFEDIFGFNSRAWRTTFALLFKPGFLSKEYFRGRRASYVQPIRLYLITSIVFFLMLSLINSFSTPIEINITGVDGQSLEQLKELNTNLDPEAENLIETKIAEIEAAQNTKKEIETEIDEALNLNLSGEEDILNLPFFSAESKKELVEILKTQGIKATELAKENPREFASIMLELAPPVIFCLLPLFAMLLKIVYIRKDFYFSEHLIFAIHNHCFIFLALIALNLSNLLFGEGSISDWLSTIIALWIPIYLWLSLKNVYQQGNFFTTIKFILLGLGYSIMLGIGIIIAVFVGVLTL